MAFTAGERLLVRATTRAAASVALSAKYVKGIHSTGDSYVAFCAAMGVPGTPPPFTADLIMDWMSDYCKEGYTARSLAGRLSSLRRFARSLRAPFPDQRSLDWLDVVDQRKALLKIDPTDPNRATVVSVAWLRTVAAHLNLTTIADLYNPRCPPWALQMYARAVVCHCCMMRGVESRDGMRMDDITIVTPGFAVLHVADRYSSKKLKMVPGRRCVVPFVAEMGISSPGHVLLAYLRRLRTGCSGDALLFPRINRDGTISELEAETDADFIRKFKIYLSLAGMDQVRLAKVSNHSFRAGGATDWSVGGLSEMEIAEQGGWTSRALRRYIRPQGHHAHGRAVRMRAAIPVALGAGGAARELPTAA